MATTTTRFLWQWTSSRIEIRTLPLLRIYSVWCRRFQPLSAPPTDRSIDKQDHWNQSECPSGPSASVSTQREGAAGGDQANPAQQQISDDPRARLKGLRRIEIELLAQ